MSVRPGSTDEGVFDHLLGDELRWVVRAERGPRPRAFQARYQKRGGGVARSLRMAAVGFTAVALTAGGVAYAATAGTGRAYSLSWAQGGWFAQEPVGAQSPVGGGASQASGRAAPARAAGHSASAGSGPHNQTGSQGQRSGSKQRLDASQSSKSQPSPDPSPSDDPHHAVRHHTPGG
jgi:hypothetical protein